MRTETEILQVLQAVEEADPNLEDDVMSMIHDTLRWVLGHDAKSVDAFIQDYIEEV